MHILISALWGIIAAWGLCRKNETIASGGWVLRAALFGAIFPYLDVIFEGVAYVFSVPMPARFGVLWSPFLAPFYAGVVATVCSWWCKGAWGRLFISALIGLWATIVGAILTESGILLAPFMSEVRLKLSVLHSVDFILLGLGGVIVLLSFVLPAYRRDVARIGLLFALVYIGAVGVLKYQAYVVGKSYARALSLEGVVIKTLPQPLSPLNWRVMVSSAEGVHDTLIHVQRKDVLTADVNASRLWQVQALYQPINRAIWREYKRYGERALTAAQKRYADTLIEGARIDWSGDMFALLVLTDFTLPPLIYADRLEACLELQDMRYVEQAHLTGGVYLVCANKTATVFNVFRQVIPAVEGREAVWRELKLATH